MRSEVAIIGECTECEGRMIETAAFTTDSERRATLFCADCQTHVRIEHELTPGGIEAIDADGVRECSLESVAWVDCERCHGRGEILGCIDDICHAKGVCIHDGNDPCPACDGTGAQPRVTATDGGRDVREWIRERVEARIDLDDPSDQYNPWTSKYHLRQDIEHGEFGRDEVLDACDEMARDGEFLYWHGWITPKREDALTAVIQAEKAADVTRQILIGKCNRALQALRDDQLVTDGGRDYEHVVEVPDRETQIPIECPGCGETFTELLSSKIGGSSCPDCGDMIEYVRPSERRDRGEDGEDDTEQTTLVTDGGTRGPLAICAGCGKVPAGRALGGQCTDCGGQFVEATDDRLACDRCGDADASRVLNCEAYDRLCTDCVDWTNRENPECPEPTCERRLIEWSGAWECPGCWRHVDADDQLATDGGFEFVDEARPPKYGPHTVPRIECGRCGHEHHIDCATGEYQGHCSNCYGFLRRPSEVEQRRFYDFMAWKARFVEAESDRRVVTDGGIDRHDLGDRWGERAEENVETWGNQRHDVLLLALIEEVGEVAMAMQNHCEGGAGLPPNAVPYDQPEVVGRDLIAEMASLGRQTRAFLEDEFPEPAGRDADGREHIAITGDPTDADRIVEEVEDAAPLLWQLHWALQGGDSE
ncbi:hypothetical protein ACFQL1_15140 [Halomicroarcula sp. GCM10025709]|uniref:hypothetical protein n=1 Tax=Haloarcula TaxID=2237 RepID=UPI0024C44685|nr:hypothetical protein [Halomicroarcula sp. YJ-61-S]